MVRGGVVGCIWKAELIVKGFYVQLCRKMDGQDGRAGGIERGDDKAGKR